MVAGINQQVPGGMFLGIAVDTADHTASPTGFGFDQHGDMPDLEFVAVGVVFRLHGQLPLRREDKSAATLKARFQSYILASRLAVGDHLNTR